jgi:SNF2 family DNA or RNA helicase
MEAVSIITTTHHGDDAVEVVYKKQDASIESKILYLSHEEGLSLKTTSRNFSASPLELKLASEAYRIKLAHLFDPFLAIHTSDVEPLPHQIAAVYETMLPKLPLRFVLADDPGAGKTIMTGLYIKELILRGDLKRCLIVAP